MDRKSRVLIEEMVLPDYGVDWASTHADLTMMACHAAKERNQGQWERLIGDAGLKLVHQRGYEGGWGKGCDFVFILSRKEESG